MSQLKEFTKRKPRLASVILWIISAVLTIACFMYQDKTGPTYPLEGQIGSSLGEINYKFLRSETIGTDLKIMFLDPIPEGIVGHVQYRRYKSNDEWAVMPMSPGNFEFSRRGNAEVVNGIGAELPFFYRNAPGNMNTWFILSPTVFLGRSMIIRRAKGMEQQDSMRQKG